MRNFSTFPRAPIALSTLAVLIALPAASMIIEKDDREEISKTRAALRLTAAEVEQARMCTGYIACPANPPFASTYQSAGSVCATADADDSSCKPDRIVTSAHMFVSERNPISRNIAPACEFYNYNGFRSSVVMSDLGLANPVPWAHNPHHSYGSDKVVLRLSKQIPGCKPYVIGEGVKAKDKVIAVTYRQSGMAARFKGKEPIAYPCEVLRTFRTRENGPQVFYTDCDATPGGSGGFLLSRSKVSKKLFLNGIIAWGGPEDRNGQSVDPTTLANATRVVGVTGHFRDMLLQPGALPKPKPPIADGLDSWTTKDGVQLSRMSDELRRRFNLGRSVQGVVVTEVSRFAVSGMQPGDVIVSINKSAGDSELLTQLDPVSGPGEIKEVLEAAQKAKLSYVMIEFLRDGQQGPNMLSP